MRTLAIVAGLTLGFVSAGYVTWPSLLGPAGYAQADAMAGQPDAGANSETSRGAVHQVGAHDESALAGHREGGQAAAAKRVPGDEAGRPAPPGWYVYGVAGSLALFALGLVIGIPLTRLNREPSRPTGQHGH